MPPVIGTTVTKVSDRLVHITTTAIAGGDTKIFAFPGSSQSFDIALPEFPDWQPRTNELGDHLSLSDLIEARITVLTDVDVVVPISVVKTGTTQDDFLITLHNDTAATLSGGLEIWVEFH